MKMTVPHSPTPVQMQTLEETLQTLFTQKAEELARRTKFVQRTSELTGAIFAQTLVFGWLACPEATYPQLQQLAASQGAQVSTQALEQRMTGYAAAFLQALLQETVSQAMQTEGVRTELLQRFNGVYLQDGSIISLPEALEEEYRGCGGNTEHSARSAMRIQVRLNLTNGQMQGPWLQAARANEQAGEGSLESSPLPKGSLFLADSKYFSQATFKRLEAQGVYGITHARADLAFFDERGVRSTLKQYLQAHADHEVIDTQVTLGRSQACGQKVRLILFRVSDETAQRRRDQANRNTKTRGKGSRGDIQVGKKHQRPSQDGRHRSRPSSSRLQLAQWTMLVTNAPATLLTALEVRVLMRCRWQSELIWCLWKQRGQLDIWRSEKPMRILCEVLAKLLAMVVQHWLIIVGCWHNPHRSLIKASQVVRLFAVPCVLTLLGPVSLGDVLAAAKRAMSRAAIPRSKNRPGTSRLLEQPLLAQERGETRP